MAWPAEVDIANADLVLTDLLTAISRGKPVVIADLSRCSFCDCAGARALLVASAQADLLGVQLRLVAAARPVLRVLDITGLSETLAIYPTRSAASRGVEVPAGTVTPLRGPGYGRRHLHVTHRQQADVAGCGRPPDPQRSP